MKYLQRNEMKKVKGGEEDNGCVKKCKDDYNTCIANGIDLQYCSRDKSECILRCIGKDPISRKI